MKMRGLTPMLVNILGIAEKQSQLFLYSQRIPERPGEKIVRKITFSSLKNNLDKFDQVCYYNNAKRKEPLDRK